MTITFYIQDCLSASQKTLPILLMHFILPEILWFLRHEVEKFAWGVIKSSHSSSSEISSRRRNVCSCLYDLIILLDFFFKLKGSMFVVTNQTVQIRFSDKSPFSFFFQSHASPQQRFPWQWIGV